MATAGRRRGGHLPRTGQSNTRPRWLSFPAAGPRTDLGSGAWGRDPQTSGGASTNCSGRSAWPLCLMTATLPPSALRWAAMVRCGTVSHSSGRQRRPGDLLRGWSWDRCESTCPPHRAVQGFGSSQGPAIRDKGGLLSQRFAGHSDPIRFEEGFTLAQVLLGLGDAADFLYLASPGLSIPRDWFNLC